MWQSCWWRLLLRLSRCRGPLVRLNSPCHPEARARLSSSPTTRSLWKVASWPTAAHIPDGGRAVAYCTRELWADAFVLTGRTKAESDNVMDKGAAGWACNVAGWACAARDSDASATSTDRRWDGKARTAASEGGRSYALHLFHSRQPSGKAKSCKA